MPHSASMSPRLSSLFDLSAVLLRPSPPATVCVRKGATLLWFANNDAIDQSRSRRSLMKNWNSATLIASSASTPPQSSASPCFSAASLQGGDDYNTRHSSGMPRGNQRHCVLELREGALLPLSQCCASVEGVEIRKRGARGLPTRILSVLHPSVLCGKRIPPDANSCSTFIALKRRTIWETAVLLTAVPTSTTAEGVVPRPLQ